MTTVSRDATRIQNAAWPLTVDISAEARIDATVVDGLVAKCVAEVTDCLKLPTPRFSEFQRGQLSLIFVSERHTHHAIRDLLRHETKNPIPASAMTLVRVQLEELFAICLILDQPHYLETYMKSGWKALYLEHLIAKTEWGSLPRIAADLQKQEAWVELMRGLSGVTSEEKATIESEELGTPLTRGPAPQPIGRFPTPGKSLGLIKNSVRRSMLTRFYLEYKYLSTFAHSSPGPRTILAALDPRPLFPVELSSAQVYEIFQRSVAIPAIVTDLLCVVQSCSEVVTIYPAQIDLRRVLEEAWKFLMERSLLANAIWQMRTRELIGIIE